MPQVEYRGRRAVRLENDIVRVTLTLEGGHVAEILHKPTGVNPLWTPRWPSIEPSTYSPAKHPEYGDGPEARLLAGIMGHNLCLDLFGGPSAEEAAAGITVHGESSVAAYTAAEAPGAVTLRGTLPAAQLGVSRTLRLQGDRVAFEETVENIGSFDRPIAWTQHVTLGAPFLDHGKTRFELTASRSKTYEGDFGDLYPRASEFEWPYAPALPGGTIDLRVYPDKASSAGFTTHLMNPVRDDAWFVAYSPASRVMFGYRWKRVDFPWCGVWEENRSRKQTPWNGQTVARGFEFGVSPYPETRRQMIDRGPTFGVPGFRWLPAKQRITVGYEARIAESPSPELASFFS
ncbi:MAG TPA: hypothetical protein VER03_21800 [Bryobacteraceae bacterium]|nr:hypothetical protein [Bryobacteraceae bacterium]